ncbi:MAG: bifunctional phosphopantothenoylcysteine decarboxylase/phosphopantothenate--cysteine ligase CoaBC [Limosilactobacillus gorillae]|jgi:phosphopantothenoylcysteine decarboxylase / phosphopantothenate---cysteine ligase|uniref:bifunctional phosphopantothenoylcysteine decarboxylase/phosphopantothenate--cysteine ligase CoaBC n=1 Tax=Limosilactobacillus gorillae TaxID=1450649 RepID=UPI000B2CD0F0|nr:bifunctional phosphopantothenoylcysteine decarboxylase/phosphopantothenate--cysteine ligase CoaBC [Limosilactobacillus gorillae]MDO4855361.1 bifunctional phosphopantothenoylcysteine decarboxylase/phosphopantothenate--cysteine ligase CoaBC [Limosilactobacillus gorillae]
MARIAVYVTGSIAAYKAVSVVRDLQRAGHEVRVAQTKAAQQFVGPATWGSLTHHPVVDDLWAMSAEGQVPHVHLADWSDLALVVPASADVLAKMASGLADDAVTSALLATQARRLVVPAMNSHMWANPATQRNVAQLKKDGVHFLEPTDGMLAEGYAGKGRMPEPATISKWVDSFLNKSNALTKKRVVVTAGGTREPLDPVRFIGNRSSGKMGIAIAKAAALRGADVNLIVGQVSVEVPHHPNIRVQRVETTEELFEKVDLAFEKADALVMAAAVADFRLAKPNEQKIKKDQNGNLTLQLVKTTDILKVMGQKKGKRLVVGFAAETEHLLENGTAELARKNADLIVANDITKAGSGFGKDTNQVTIISRDQDPVEWPQMSKRAVAEHLIDLIGQRLTERK